LGAAALCQVKIWQDTPLAYPAIRKCFSRIIVRMTQKKWWQRFLPHGIALLVFIGTAVVYCRPAFEHKVLVQEDITQWRAMARSSFQFKQQHGEFPLWTESMFSGMPAYLIAMEARAFAPHYAVQDLLSFHLPKPAGFFVLACICMYFLTQVLQVNTCIGIISGLAYAYATYNPVIISVGHDTKMQAIALLPAFIAGLILIYEKKYAWGSALTALCTALLVGANHMQIFYYGLIIAGGMTTGYIVRWVIRKEWKHLILHGFPAAATRRDRTGNTTTGPADGLLGRHRQHGRTRLCRRHHLFPRAAGPLCPGQHP